MSVSQDEIRMGDTVLLRNGERVVVDSVIEWYADSTGKHDGPFVNEARTYDRYLLADVAEIVERNPRICEFCGNGVTSPNPEVTFCRGCFYNGTAFEDRYADVIEVFQRAFPDHWATIEHTGGGCFWLAIHPLPGSPLAARSPYYWALTAGDAVLPMFEEGELWGIVMRYCADEERAQTVVVGEIEFNEYEGVPVLESETDKDGMFLPNMSHEQVIEAIRKDMEAIS
jgi:hypothetical protein